MTQDWLTASGTARGAHHEQTGAPNEDHVRITRGDPLVATVADGHGAPQYTRAQRGSRLATQAATEVLPRHLDDLDALPAALVDRWRELVGQDVAEDPPTDAETVRMEPRELYGTTLLATAVLDDRLVLVQLGDGDTILATCGEHGTALRPVPPMRRTFLGATDSLVQPDAAAAVRVAVVPCHELEPDLVLLASDGLEAAQRGRDWFREVAAAWCDRLRGRGIDGLDEAVTAWCAQLAATGGDDATVALLVRRRLLTGRADS